MQKRARWVASALASFALCGLTLAAEKEAVQEVHAVSIDGARPNPATKIGAVTVKVDRPGKEVTLVLSAARPTDWAVAVGAKSKVVRIVLQGSERQTVSDLGENTEIDEEPILEDGLPLSEKDRHFRTALDALKERTGRELSTYYMASYLNVPLIVIDRVDDNPVLRTDYPQPTPASELPKLEFEAVHWVYHDYHCSRSSFGKFTLLGPVEDSLRPLPGWSRHVFQIAKDADDKHWFASGVRDYLRVDWKRRTIEGLPQGAPSFGLEAGVTYDCKRKRFLWLDGNGLTAYDAVANKWQPLERATRVINARGVAYSEQKDLVYCLILDRAPEAEGASLWLLARDSEGVEKSRVPVSGPALENADELSAPFDAIQLIAVDKHLVLIVHPSGAATGEKGKPTRIHLLDPETGKARLTARY